MKKSIAILCIILIIFSLTSCSVKASYVDDESDNSKLQVYLMEYDYDIENAIEKYNIRVGSGGIDSRQVEATIFKYEQIDDMYSKLASELMVGKGPDFILIDFFFCMENDFVKMASQGIFADMDILAANSDTFNFDDYNKMVMDAAVIGGTRPFMPISYCVPYIYSTEEAIANSGIDIPDKLTYENILDMIDEFEQNKPIKYYTFYSDILMNDIFSLHPSLTIDDSIFSVIQERIKNQYIQNDNEASHSSSNEIISGASIFDTVTLFGQNQFNHIMMDYTYIKKLYDNELIFWNLPYDKNGNPKAFIDIGIAINFNSRHKNDAFKFVEYMMSYDYAASQDSGMTLPVNNQAFKDYIDKFNHQSFNFYFSDGGYGTDMTTISLPNELADEFIELVESPKVCEFNGQGVYIYYNLVRDTLKEYYTQKIDYDTMIEQLKTKLNLYYSE